MRKSNKTKEVKHFKGHFLITLQSTRYVNKALLQSHAPPSPSAPSLLSGGESFPLLYYPLLWFLEETAKVIPGPFSLNTNVKCAGSKCT